jgi:ribosomal protein S18 acetylase RimI-like enzyme
MGTETTGSITFRRMLHDDINSVLALGQSSLAYGDLASADPDSPLAMSFVADADGKIIGFILARAHFVGIPIREVCIIHAIAVDPAFQHQGIGTQLLSKLEDRCESDDIQIMRMLLPQNDTGLRNYMTALGFKQSYLINFDKVCGGEG